MTDTPKTWGEMTDAEKGALLLAAYRGRAIQVWATWMNPKKWIIGSDFNPCRAYRIKPKLKRETVNVYGQHFEGSWSFGVLNPYHEDTHRITFATIDGEPDCASIKMERIE